MLSSCLLMSLCMHMHHAPLCLQAAACGNPWPPRSLLPGRRPLGRACSTEKYNVLNACSMRTTEGLVVHLQASKARRAAADADTRKLKRRKAHSAPGSVEIKPERRKRIVAELE